jgi:hypothetical protein
MPFADRLIHPLNIVRQPWDDANRDEHGQPTPGVPSVTAVSGLVQPKSAKEVANITQAGAAVSDHVIFLPVVDLIAADAIEHDPDDGRRYEIVGVREFAFGSSPHLEVDARMVRGAVREVGS